MMTIRGPSSVIRRPFDFEVRPIAGADCLPRLVTATDCRDGLIVAMAQFNWAQRVGLNRSADISARYTATGSGARRGGERLTKERLTKERLTKERLTAEQLTKEQLARR